MSVFYCSCSWSCICTLTNDLLFKANTLYQWLSSVYSDSSCGWQIYIKCLIMYEVCTMWKFCLTNKPVILTLYEPSPIKHCFNLRLLCESFVWSWADKKHSMTHALINLVTKSIEHLNMEVSTLGTKIPRRFLKPDICKNPTTVNKSEIYILLPKLCPWMWHLMCGNRVRTVSDRKPETGKTRSLKFGLLKNPIGADVL